MRIDKKNISQALQNWNMLYGILSCLIMGLFAPQIALAQADPCENMHHLMQKHRDVCDAFMSACVNSTVPYACDVLDNAAQLSDDERISFWISLEYFISDTCLQMGAACDPVAIYGLYLQ